MSIDISVKGGVDFNAYLADFAASFAAASRGFFSDNPTDLSGDEYALSESSDTTLPIDDGQSFIAGSGDAGDFNYDFMSHFIYGTLDSLEFGDGLTYDGTADDFATDLALSISGLGLVGDQSEGSANAVNALLLDLMNGNTDVLLSYLENADLNFAGSGKSDAFTGFNGDDAIAGGAGGDDLKGGKGADELYGGKGADDLVGGRGADVLEGGQGADRLTGGAGADTFAFNGSNFGNDVVKDFGGADVIALDVDGFDDFDDVLAAASENADGDVVITIDGDSSITLKGVSIDDLTSDDFLFS